MMLIESKTPHLWKFMRCLLESATYNPQYIRWENKQAGVFRIVPGQSRHIASLWGLMKNNPTMTFEKLSRSLRYHCWCCPLLTGSSAFAKEVMRSVAFFCLFVCFLHVSFITVQNNVHDIFWISSFWDNLYVVVIALFMAEIFTYLII